MKFEIFVTLFCAGTSFVLSIINKKESSDVELSKLDNKSLNGMLVETLQTEAGVEKANQVYKEKYAETLVTISDRSGFVVEDNIIHVNYALAKNFLKDSFE